MWIDRTLGWSTQGTRGGKSISFRHCPSGTPSRPEAEVADLGCPREPRAPHSLSCFQIITGLPLHLVA